MALQKVRLKGIRTVSFRQSELTNYDWLRKKRKFATDLKPNEVYLLVSKMGNQLVWILNDAQVKVGENGDAKRMLDTRRWRLDSRTPFNPLMIQNYANEVGIELVGIKKLQDHL